MAEPLTLVRRYGRWLWLRAPSLAFGRFFYRVTQAPAGEASWAYPPELGGDLINEPGKLP